MGIHQLREELIEKLRTAPEEVVRQVEQIMLRGPEQYAPDQPDDTVLGYTGDKPFTLGTLRDRMKRADEAIEKGELLTVDQMRERLEKKWAERRT